MHWVDPTDSTTLLQQYEPFGPFGYGTLRNLTLYFIFASMFLSQLMSQHKNSYKIFVLYLAKSARGFCKSAHACCGRGTMAALQPTRRFCFPAIVVQRPTSTSDTSFGARRRPAAQPALDDR